MILRSVCLQVILATFLTGVIYHGTVAQSSISADTLYSFTDEMPQFIGGEMALLDTVFKNIELPAYEGSFPQSKYIIQYTVEKDGSVSDISVNARRKEEKNASKKVFSELKFIPAKLNGEVVRFRMMIPIHISYK